MLGSRHRLSKDLGRIKSISAKLDIKMAETKTSDDNRIDQMSYEELQDLDKVVSLANFVLTKYQDKKEMHSILKGFVEIVSDSAQSLQDIDDEISMLILDAEGSIGRIKDMHTRISDKSDLRQKYQKNPDYEPSPINLTNTDTEIDTVEYQQTRQGSIA